MTTKPQLEADLSDPQVFDHGSPQGAFATLQRTPGLMWNALPTDGPDAGFWSVGRFDDALTVRASMIDRDLPDLTRLRRLVNPEFIPRVLKTYTEIVRDRVGDLLDAMLVKRGGDWVEGVSKPIPIGIICDMLGVPEKDRDLMIEMTDHLVAGIAAEPLDPTAYGNTTMPVHAGYGGGGGVHTCLGAGLARIELKVLIQEIIARDIRIEVVGEPESISANFVNGVEKLQVRLSRGA